MGRRLDVELGRQVRVAGGGGRQLIEHVVVTLGLGLVGDPRLLQEVILAEIHVNINKTVLKLGCNFNHDAMDEVSFIDCLMKFLMMR